MWFFFPNKDVNSTIQQKTVVHDKKLFDYFSQKVAILQNLLFLWHKIQLWYQKVFHYKVEIVQILWFYNKKKIVILRYKVIFYAKKLGFSESKYFMTKSCNIK